MQMSAQPAHLESIPQAPHSPQSSLSVHSSRRRVFASITIMYASMEGSSGLILMPGHLQVVDLLQPRKYLPIPPTPQAKSSVDRNKEEPLRKKEIPNIGYLPTGLHTHMRARKWAESPQKQQHIMELFGKDHCLVKA